MDLEQNNSLAKLPLLKQGEYDTWRLRIESYIQLQDYSLWEIIEEGNSFKPVAQTTREADGTSTTTIPGAVTIEEKILKKNDLKARSILMMTLPSEHLLTFNKHKDAKSLFEAIEARFGGNEATKKTQKTLLKQMYETFSENITLEELNLKFLRSLPTEWGMHVVVWRNKSDLGSISFDDLYNNFKIVEPEVKRSITSSSNSVSQNLAFVSGHSSTNDDNIANVHVSTGSSPVSTNNSTACLSDPLWQLALLSMKARKFYQRTGKKIVINGRDTAGYDKKKVECFNCHKLGHFARECRNPKSQENKGMKRMVLGFDWSYMAQEEASTNFALMAFSDSEVQNNKTCSKTCLKNYEDLKTQYDKLRVELRKSESDLSNYKRGLASVEERLVFYKKNESMLNDQIVVLKRDASYKDSDINGLFAPPSVNLSSSGIEKFKEPEFEGYVFKQGINAVKPTAYWAWRPKVKMINHVYKNTGFCVCKQFDYVDPTGRNKVLNSPYFMVKSWLVQDQTVLGQTATGKESSNPFMAGSLPKTISSMIHISQEVILLKEERTVSKDSEVCKITKADGTSSFHGDFQALLRRLDRQDLFQLYSLVQERYKHRSLEGHDLDLWGDLKMMFDPNEEDDIWLNQHHWELLRWKLHEYSGVHSLFLDGTSIQINMLVDKKYPLKKEILKKMINLKIEAEEESNMASELIKFIKSQIAEQVNHKFRGGLLGIKELLQDMLLKNLVPLVKELSTCVTRSSTNKLYTPYKDPEREFRSSKKHFKSLSLDELRSSYFNLLSDKEYSEEEEAMAETMEQYMSKTLTDYGSGVARPKIDNNDHFELKGQFLMEPRENTFSGSDNEDANEHIEKVLKRLDLFPSMFPNITCGSTNLRVFHNILNWKPQAIGLRNDQLMFNQYFMKNL
ncbi:ribonuclease H-like domain-containing protein [Tanacetum coccineum]